MIALGINASPRKTGNCHILLKEALKGARDSGFSVETISLDDLNISPWRERSPNRKLGQSPIKDDADKIIAKIVSADAIILASPIYFGSLSAQAKILIDRCQVLWERKMLLRKLVRKNKAKAALICVEASGKRDFLKNAQQVAKNFFAVTDAKYVTGLFCTGLEREKDALKFPGYLKKAYKLGKALLP